MNGAIFFSSKYGSTAQYAIWISDATGLPVFDVEDIKSDPSKYDFLIIGSPIIYYKLLNHKWIKENLTAIENKPVILFTVSGAPAGPKLDGWIAGCLPQSLISQVKHVALQGRQRPDDLTWFDWMMLRIGALMNKNPEARKQELQGFDKMDKSSIEPILKLVEQFQPARTSSGAIPNLVK